MTDRSSTAQVEECAFKPLFAVDPAHRAQAEAAEALFQEALAESATGFRFGPIQAAAKDLPGGSLVRIIPGFGLQERAPAHVMVLTLKEAVRQALARPLGDEAFWERVEETLTGAFVGLDGQRGAPHFVPRPEPEGTGYDYHLLFALEGGPEDDTEGFLYVVAFCVHVTVGLDEAQVLNLALTDTAPFTIQLDALCVRQPLG